jgi:hypothetical protein
VLSENILNIGIKNIKPRDIQFANEKGLRIKLFASARKNENQISAFVAPHFIESTHSAFYVDEEFNAVVVQAAYADKQLFYGKGAGSFPTASAVLSDISALQFNYKYEYRKAVNNDLQLETDFNLYVFISAESRDKLQEIIFNEIDDEDEKTQIIDEYELLSSDNYDLNDDDYSLNMFLKYLNIHAEKIFPNIDERNICYSIIHLFERRENIEILSKVSSAIEENSVLSFLQPIFDIQTKEIYN